MHELSIAQSLIDLVQGQLAVADPDPNAIDRVSVIHAKIGALSSVIPAALESAFQQAKLDTPLSRATLQIERINTTAWCTACNSEKTPLDPRRLRCPDCGQPTPDLRHGLELELSTIELLDPDTEDSHATNARSANPDPQEERCDRAGTADAIP